MKKGVKKRVQRIKESGKTGKEAKQLARKRAESYRSANKAQKAQGAEGVGRGKKGTLKRKVHKAGGSKTELAALKSLNKTQRKQVKKSSRSKNYSIRGTASNLLRQSAEKSQKANPNPPARPSIARAMYELRKAAGLDGKE